MNLFQMRWEEYKQIIELEKTNMFEFKMNVFRLFYPLENVDKISSKELNKKTKPYFDELKALKTKDEFVSRLSIEPIGELKYKSIYEFNLGEYIDLENFIFKNDNDRLLSLIYRKIKLSEFDKDVWEDWGGYSHKRSYLFDELDASTVISGIKNIMRERSEFLDKHKGIFPQDIDEEEPEDLDEQTRKMVEKEKEVERVKKAFNFEFLIHSITGGDVLKIEDTLKMNVDLLFKFLLVDKQYNLIYYNK
jgi:hypothetical protein